MMWWLLVCELRPVAGRDFPATLPQLQSWFADDDACRAYLERLRWPEGFVCPSCGAVDAAARSATRRRGAPGSTMIAGMADLDDVIAVLRSEGARFAYLHGSRAEGSAKPGSDLDVAACFGQDVDPVAVGSRLPGGVDLVVLDTAPLELAGRIALRGKLLFDDDPPRRVEWEATTRKIYLDERPRIEQARRDFAEARARGRR